MILGKAPTSTRGSLAVEGALTLLPLSLAVVLNLELGVRANRHAVLSWVTCAMVRERALGESWTSAEKLARERIQRAGMEREENWEETRTEEGLSLRGHSRYPALWNQASPRKHHFEVNELCRFPF